MKTLIDYLIMYMFYLAPALPLTAVIFLIFRLVLKAKVWYLTDLVGIFIPGALWVALYEQELIGFFRDLSHSKGMGNVIVEQGGLGIVYSLLFLLRSIAGRKYPGYSKGLSLLALLMMVLVTIAIYVFTPGLPE